MTLSKKFKKAAMGLGAAGVVLGALGTWNHYYSIGYFKYQGHLRHLTTINPPDGCVTQAEINSGKDSIAAFYHSVQKDLATTATGRFVLEQKKADKLAFCTKAIMYTQSGGMVFGVYDFEKDRLTIRSRTAFGMTVIPLAAIHELRHRQQGMDGIPDDDGLVNASLAERVNINLASELDARLRAIVMAYEKEQMGEPQYAEELRWLTGHRAAFDAYKAQIQKDPKDSPAAMRAGFLVLLQSAPPIYVVRFVAQVQLGEQMPKLDVPLQALITDERLAALGRTPHGSYIDEDLKTKIRTIFSDADVSSIHEMLFPPKKTPRKIPPALMPGS